MPGWDSEMGSQRGLLMVILPELIDKKGVDNNNEQVLTWWTGARMG